MLSFIESSGNNFLKHFLEDTESERKKYTEKRKKKKEET
jgi:hypothetical protein